MIFYLLFKVTILAVMMICITQLKYNAVKSAVIIAAFNAAIWICNFMVYTSMGTEFMSSIFPLTASIPAFIGFIFVSRFKVLQVLFSFLTITIFGTLSSFIGGLPFGFTNIVIMRPMIEFLVFALTIVFVVKIFRKPYFRIMEALEKGWGLLCLVPGLLIVIIYMLQYYPTRIQNRPEDIPVIFLVFALTFVFYLIVFLNFENISHYFQFKQDRKAISVQADMYKKEYIAMMDNIHSNKIYRHDMKHHLSAINTFLNDNNISEAQKYIGKLDESLSKSVIEKYCENYIMNAILSSYINKAKKEQIEVVHEVAIPENIAIDNIELGLIFANAIDNAINACKKIENPNCRSISIVCKEHCGQMYIRICNPFVGEVQFDGEYPVSNSADHGIGTRSIAAIAEKNEGVFSFAVQDGVFKTTVTLKC